MIRENIDRLNMRFTYRIFGRHALGIQYNATLRDAHYCGKATKYYAYDLETTYKAVKQASDQLKIEATLTNSVRKEKYSLETKGHIPMPIDIIRLIKSVTSVITSIPTFGNKHYFELFYKLVDDNLPRKTAAVDKEKTS